MSTKRRLLMTLIFLLSLVPMALSQFVHGEYDLPGFLVLTTPVGFFACLFVLLGLWCPFSSPRTNRLLCTLGLPGMVAAELYTCLTWYAPAVLSIRKSLTLVSPAFFLGLAASAAAVLLYLLLRRDAVRGDPAPLP